MHLYPFKSLLTGLWLSTFLIAASGAIPADECHARKVKTTLKSSRSYGKSNSPHESKLSRAESPTGSNALNGLEVQDSVELEFHRDRIHFSGYDKIASSAYESFCLTNSSPNTVAGVILDMTYLDLEGRMINRREVSTPVIVPPGETRTITLKHYDRQKTLYYKRSTPPKRGGIPYDVRIFIKNLYILRD